MYHRCNKQVKLIVLVILAILITSCLKDETESQLLFSHITLNETEFYMMNANGTGLKLLTTIPNSHSFYGLSPDGKKLAIGMRPKTLNIFEVPSGKLLKNISDVGVSYWHELTEKGNIVSWAPDSERLVFLRELSDIQGIELVLYNMRDDSQIVLANDNALYRSPEWAPDGKQFAVAKLDSCGLPFLQCSPEDQNWNIFVFDVEKQTSDQITNFDNIAGRFQDFWSRSLCGIHWSPTGGFILFENSCSQFGSNPGKELFVVSVQSKEVVQLTDFDYDDNRYIVHYTPKWIKNDDQLVVGYSIIPMMPPSYELVASHGYHSFKSGNFDEASSISLDIDSSIYPVWTTIDEDLILIQYNEDTNCRQLYLGEYVDSEFVVTLKTDWPLLVVGSDVLRTPDGRHLAYLTADDNCDLELTEQLSIVFIDMEKEQVIISDTAKLSGDIELISWFENPTED